MRTTASSEARVRSADGIFAQTQGLRRRPHHAVRLPWSRCADQHAVAEDRGSRGKGFRSACRMSITRPHETMSQSTRRAAAAALVTAAVKPMVPIVYLSEMLSRTHEATLGSVSSEQ